MICVDVSQTAVHWFEWRMVQRMSSVREENHWELHCVTHCCSVLDSCRDSYLLLVLWVGKFPDMSAWTFPEIYSNRSGSFRKVKKFAVSTLYTVQT